MLQIKHSRGRQPVYGRKQLHPALKAFRNTLIAILVLGGLLVGGGVGYTWYNSQVNGTPPKDFTVKMPAPQKTMHKPSPTSKVNASVAMLTTPIAPGNNASISVHTNIDANCTITVAYNKVAAKDSGLLPKKADELGNVTWTWTVPTTAPLGKWPATVTCANQKNSGMVIGDLVVSKSAAPIPASN